MSLDEAIGYALGRPGRTEGSSRRAELSPRELEVVRLVAAGRSNREIADTLVLSIKTVERHLANIYGKIGARGRADATAYAVRHELI
jgi:DNA-binding CsgD family transcriptional regulator